MATHNEIGTKGEEAAADFLKKNGHEILSRNYRFGKAEVDIISQEKNVIVFTEVKTRGSSLFGHPEEFVVRKKKKLLKQAAEEYMRIHNVNSDIRFDIISIIHRNGDLTIEHFKDAFFNLDNEMDDKYH